MDLVATTYPFRQAQPFDQPAEFEWLRRNAPVAEVRLFNGATAWLVTRYDEARAVLGDPRFSRRPIREAAFAQFNGDPTKAADGFDFGVSVAEAPGHTRWRRMVNKAFGARQAEALRGRVGELADGLLDEVAAGARPVDLMGSFAFRLPIQVLCELLRVPDDGRPVFTEWAAAIRDVQNSLDNFGTAMRTLGLYVGELVAERRRDPGDDVLTRLLDVRDGDGGAFTDRELVATVLLLVIGGYETTGVQFGNGLFALLTHPAELDRLRAEPAMLPAAVEEILRYAQASTGFAGAMLAKEDVELGGVTIPEGATVFVSADAANRDEAHFSDPDEFEPARDGAARHLTFGSGAHFCLGAPLARVQLQEGIDRMLRRFPDIRLAAGPEDVEFTSNLFSHYPRELPVSW